MRQSLVCWFIGADCAMELGPLGGQYYKLSVVWRRGRLRNKTWAVRGGAGGVGGGVPEKMTNLPNNCPAPPADKWSLKF